MIRIEDTLLQLISRTPELSFGFHHKLFNLTALSKFLKPLIEERTKKRVTVSSVVMALSRMQRKEGLSFQVGEMEVVIERISVHVNLNLSTYANTPEHASAANLCYRQIRKREKFITITEGVSEITLIFDDSETPLVRDQFKARPSVEKTHVSSVSVKFHQRYLNEPGFLYRLLQVLAIQGINVLELASTATEIVFYVREQEMQRTFDTLAGCFRRKGREKR